eukprot:scaffold3876_cov344-Prasinococcus_capsulatus_cf.AAC.1
MPLEPHTEFLMSHWALVKVRVDGVANEQGILPTQCGLHTCLPNKLHVSVSKNHSGIAFIAQLPTEPGSHLFLATVKDTYRVFCPNFHGLRLPVESSAGSPQQPQEVKEGYYILAGLTGAVPAGWLGAMAPYPIGVSLGPAVGGPCAGQSCPARARLPKGLGLRDRGWLGRGSTCIQILQLEGDPSHCGGYAEACGGYCCLPAPVARERLQARREWQAKHRGVRP